MELPQSEYKGVIEILTRLYVEIREIEERFGFLFGGGDFRARIDYFHDAVRAFTTVTAADFEAGGRLSVERLAYDVTALRYLQSKPLSSLNRDGKLASGAELIKHAPDSLRSPLDAPDRLTKQNLSELYQQYAILFVALFKLPADRNYQERSETEDEHIAQMNELINALESQAATYDIEELIQNLDDHAVKAALEDLLSHGKKSELKLAAKDALAKAKRRHQTLDEAHAQYVMTQLGLYESGKDIVKKLAAKGMNLAGKFVQDAMAQAQRERGR